MPETIFSFGVRGRTYDMGFSFMYFLLVCIFQCFFVPLVASQGQLAPALFIFGDSFFDSGNNNNRKTLAKANYPPYGIDFPSGVTGRFSNGLIITDYFGEFGDMGWFNQRDNLAASVMKILIVFLYIQLSLLGCKYLLHSWKPKRV